MADDAAAGAPLEQQLQSFSNELIGTIRAVVREEMVEVEKKLASQEGGVKLDISGVIKRPEFTEQVNGCMEKAFQTVLPQLIKRFKEEIEERLAEATNSADVAVLANSEAMKEMLDGRFRQMMLYLKQDVIPKAVEQKLTPA